MMNVLGTKLLNTTGTTSCVTYMKFCTTCTTSRYKKGSKSFVLATNPLIDGPDFTYLDGRPTPLTPKQRLRAQRQNEAVTKAFKLLGEVKFAVKRHEEMTQNKMEERTQIMNSKFKSKGMPIKE